MVIALDNIFLVPGNAQVLPPLRGKLCQYGLFNGKNNMYSNTATAIYINNQCGCKEVQAKLFIEDTSKPTEERSRPVIKIEEKDKEIGRAAYKWR